MRRLILLFVAWPNLAGMGVLSAKIPTSVDIPAPVDTVGLSAIHDTIYGIISFINRRLHKLNHFKNLSLLPDDVPTWMQTSKTSQADQTASTTKRHPDSVTTSENLESSLFSPCHCFQVFSVIFMGPCPLKLDFIKNYLLRDFFHHQQYHLLALSKRIGTPTRKTERWNLQQHRSCFLAKKLSVVCEFLAKPWDEGLANKRNVWNKLHPWSFRVRQLEDEVSF